MRPDPVLIAYSVKRSAKGRAVWTRIGAAYPHETGAGLTVVLSAMPLHGRIILLELDADDDARLERLARPPAERPPRGMIYVHGNACSWIAKVFHTLRG